MPFPVPAYPTLQEIHDDGQRFLDTPFTSPMYAEVEFRLFVVKALMGILRHMAVRC